MSWSFACEPRDPARCEGLAVSARFNCLESLPASAWVGLQRGPNCSSAALTLGDQARRVRIEVELADDGSVLVRAVAQLFTSIEQQLRQKPELNCYGKRVLDP